jgi:hypothetical protein
LTKEVFAAIAAARPGKLFVVADGPRFPEEAEKCQAARSVIDHVDWDCKVVRNIADQNLGCRKRIVSGLNWVFSQVDEAIILEDDCVPHQSFFTFCDMLLAHYRSDERVMEIGGCNYQSGRSRTEYSYYFSKYSHTHGWATWRRAWQYFDESITAWPQLKETGVWNLLCDDEVERKYWGSIYDMIHDGTIKTSWDYQWQLARWRQRGLTIVPNVNLVSNIGFGPQATHTRWKWKSLAQLPTEDIGSIRHPPSIIRHQEADRNMFQKVFRGSVLTRAFRKARKVWGLSRPAQ